MPPAVLEIAIRAERMVREKRKGADKAVQELAAHGETGFRAVVAMLRGGQFGDAFDPLVKATYRPGVQGLLLETISLPDVPKPSELSAIDAMIHADVALGRPSGDPVRHCPHRHSRPAGRAALRRPR